MLFKFKTKFDKMKSISFEIEWEIEFDTKHSDTKKFTKLQESKEQQLKRNSNNNNTNISMQIIFFESIQFICKYW